MKDITLIFLFTIAILSAFIAWEFYKSKDGRLRILIIQLFVSKIWVYGSTAIYYILNVTWDIWTIRFIINLPMFIVMLGLWKYIRMKDK